MLDQKERGAAKARAADPGSKPAPAAAKPSLSVRHARLLALVLTGYVLSLALLTADHVFEWGIVEPPMDWEIAARIEAFDRPLPAPPQAELDALLGEVQRAMAEAPPPVAAALWEVRHAARGFLAGVPPEDEMLENLAARVAALRDSAPPEGRPAAEFALRMADQLARLVRQTPAEDLWVLREHAETNIAPVVERHEFAVPHLIRALRRGEPQQQAVAAYCLERIALRYFNDRPEGGLDADAWAAWWRRREADLERRTRR